MLSKATASLRRTLAATIALSLSVGTASAQISMRPVPQQERQIEHPVSRDAEPVIREAPQFGNSSLAATSLNATSMNLSLEPLSISSYRKRRTFLIAS